MCTCEAFSYLTKLAEDDQVQLIDFYPQAKLFRYADIIYNLYL